MLTLLKMFFKPTVLVSIVFLGVGIYVGSLYFKKETEAYVIEEEAVEVHISYILDKIEEGGNLEVATLPFNEYKYQPENFKGKMFYLISDGEALFSYPVNTIEESDVFEGENYFVITLYEKYISNDVEFIAGENNIRGYANLLAAPEAVKELYVKAEIALEEQLITDEEVMSGVVLEAEKVFEEFFGLVTTKEIRIEFK